ncbi:dihydrodipicolinate synthase [compost metagenome]
MAPISYQALTDEEVFFLYEQVTSSLSIPLCVYDNPGTSHFRFSDELHSRIAVEKLRAVIPLHVTFGISGNPSAYPGLSAGCDLWYSVLGGLFPRLCLDITRMTQSGHLEEAQHLSTLLEPIWKLFNSYGSLRVISAAAEIIGLIKSPSLPLPLQPLNKSVRNHLNIILKELKFTV